MAKKQKTQEEATAPQAETVVEFAVLSEGAEELKKIGIKEGSSEVLLALMGDIMNVIDQNVAKSDLQPELQGIVLKRKAEGAPFTHVELDFAETVAPAEIRTLQERIEQGLAKQAAAQATGPKTKTRAIEL